LWVGWSIFKLGALGHLLECASQLSFELLNPGYVNWEKIMNTEDLRAAADKFLVRSGLLPSDVMPAEEGPIFNRADGTIIWDTDGKRYLDFNSGQMCSTLGHNNQRVTEAVQQALTELTHCSSIYRNVKQIELAIKIAETVDLPLSRSMFIQSGADSNEAATMFARRYTGRTGIGAFHLGFHGYTDVTRGMSYIAASPGYGPSVPDVYAIPTPYAYRSEESEEREDWWRPMLQMSMELLDRQFPGNLAAVICEPIPSSGGVLEMPSGYFKALKNELRSRNSLLIFDEAQTGLGKVGTMYCYQQEDVVPDIMTLSKHFGGGLAISAMITSTEIEEKVVNDGLSFGHSHSADPIGCVAGLASLEEILEEDIPGKAQKIGVSWQERMRALQQRYELIGDVRGRGCLQGLELVRSRRSKEPANTEAAAIFEHSIRNGLLFSVRGQNSNVLRFVPPFSTTEGQLDEACEILEAGICKALASASN